MKRRASVPSDIFYGPRFRRRPSLDPETKFTPNKNSDMVRRRYAPGGLVSVNKPVSIKGAKNIKVRKPKKVKVSAKLKAKIMKVIDKKVLHVNGSYTDNFAGFQYGATSRGQTVIGNMCGYGSIANPSIPGGVADPSDFHFTISEFINAASVLFNKKAIPVDSWQQYRLDGTNCLPAKNLIMDIRNSYAWYTFKNATQHAITFILVVCAPRRKGTCTEWNGDILQGENFEGINLANEQGFQSPYFHWVQSLSNDVVQGNTLQGYTPDPTSLTAAPTLRNPSINDLFRLPGESKNFGSMYKTEYVRFNLQPGQEVKYKLEGPKNLTIDCGKQFQNDLFMNVQKYSRAVMGILYNSPNTIANFTNAVGIEAQAGRWADQIDKTQAGFGLLVECTRHISLRVPEQAGFTFPTIAAVGDISGKQQILNMRVPKQVVNNWFYPCVNATNRQVVDLAIMNPQQPVGDRSGGGS